MGKSFAKLHLFSDKKLEVFGHFWYLTLTRVYFSLRKTTLRYVSPARDLRTSLVITFQCLLFIFTFLFTYLFTWKVAGGLNYMKLGRIFASKVN